MGKSADSLEWENARLREKLAASVAREERKRKKIGVLELEVQKYLDMYLSSRIDRPEKPDIAWMRWV